MQVAKRRITILALLLFVCGVAAPSRAQQGRLRVAAAADLQTAMPEIASAFQRQTGTAVDVVYGSSGNFFAQIGNGAPFDVFFSADSGYPEKLEAAGYAEPGTSAVYGVGKIVLWTPAGSRLDPVRDGWQALLDPQAKRVAIANPDHAPYGRAAVAALRRAGIYDRIKDKLVLGENISQAAQFVQLGNAQAGIIAYSLAVSPAMRDGKRWQVPAELYPPIEQRAIILKTSRNLQAARELLKFVIHGPGRAVLAKYGFAPPAN